MQGSGRRLECLERLRHHGREPLPLHLLGTGPRHDLLRLRGRQDQRFLLRPARIYATADPQGRKAGATTARPRQKAGRQPPGGRYLQGDPRRRHRQFRRGLLSPDRGPRDLRRSFGRQSSGILRVTRCTANEFDVFSAAAWLRPTPRARALRPWGKSGNIAGRPGYVKMGAEVRLPRFTPPN